MFTLKGLFTTVATLWALCLIQNQIHPKRYIDYSNYSHDAEYLSAPVKTHASDTIAVQPALDLDFPIQVTQIVYVPKFKLDKVFYAPNSFARKKLYRLFLTGLSPPAFQLI